MVIDPNHTLGEIGENYIYYALRRLVNQAQKHDLQHINLIQKCNIHITYNISLIDFESKKINIIWKTLVTNNIIKLVRFFF